MTMVSSGILKFGGTNTASPLRDSINVELLKNENDPISINDSDFRALAGVPSGGISISNVYGQTYTRYGTPSGSFNKPAGLVTLSITGGMPYADFYIWLSFTSSGQPYPGAIAPYPGMLDGNGDWSQTSNVAGSPYWYPGPYTNQFDFYQGATAYPNGTYIGTVFL